jgi:hypothetical protein
MDNISLRVDSEWAAPLDNLFAGTANTAQSLSHIVPANDNLHQFELCDAHGRFLLASQRGLRLGGLLGADRRVRRCSSLGGLTPAGASVPE